MEVTHSEREKRLYGTIIASTPDLAHVLDRSCRFTFANAALLIPLLDSEGEIIEWFGMASDATRRKEPERKADQARHLAWTMRVPEHLEVHADREKLQQILLIVRSVEGEGSTFTLALPRAAAAGH